MGPSGSIVVKDLDSLLWPSGGSFCRSASNTNDERLMPIDGLLNQGSADNFQIGLGQSESDL